LKEQELRRQQGIALANASDLLLAPLRLVLYL
jgi:hypothetical protein